MLKITGIPSGSRNHLKTNREGEQKLEPNEFVAKLWKNLEYKLAYCKGWQNIRIIEKSAGTLNHI